MNIAYNVKKMDRLADASLNTIDTLSKIAKALEVGVDDLIQK